MQSPASKPITDPSRSRNEQVTPTRVARARVHAGRSECKRSFKTSVYRAANAIRPSKTQAKSAFRLSLARDHTDDAFGNTVAETDTAITHLYGYTGREFDKETGLQYNRARYYDPSLGRWMSKDPIGFGGGDANLYRYVGNSPTYATDPSGLEGYWEGVGNVYLGYYDAGAEVVGAGWFVVRHPLKAGYEIGTSVLHPVRTFNAICGDISEKSGTLRGQGSLVGDVLIGVASGGVVKAASKTATIAKVTSKIGKAAELPDNPRSHVPEPTTPIPDIPEAPVKGLTGISNTHLNEITGVLRKGTSHLGDDVVFQGSRVAGTARAASDLDIAVRVRPDDFASLITKRFGTPNPGSAAERTMLHAIETGKIQSGEAGLRGLRKQLERILGKDVDISIIKRGGPFDNGPTLPLGGN